MIEKNTNLDIVYYALVSPGNVIEAVRERNFFFLALLLATLSLLSGFIGDNLSVTIAPIPDNLHLSFLIKLLFFYFLLLGITLLYNFIAELLGRREKNTILLTLLGFSFLPGIFKTPLALICDGLNLGNLYSILKLFAMLWIIGLQVFFLQKIYNFSFFQAMLLYLSPLLLVIFLIFFCILILLIFVALNLSRIYINL